MTMRELYALADNAARNGIDERRIIEDLEAEEEIQRMTENQDTIRGELIA